jgi:two-component system, NarL family, nitrate/nitrite response regulator NarL
MSSQLLGFDRLTRREEEVLSSLMRGAKAREICAQSFVSMPTVRSQIRSIFSKLGVTSQLAAVALAYQNGWLSRADRAREVLGTDERASA